MLFLVFSLSAKADKKILRKMEGYEKKREGDLERGYHQSLMAIKPTEVINALEELQKL